MSSPSSLPDKQPQKQLPSPETETENTVDRFYNIKAGLFLAISGGIGLLAGFGGALATTKKQDPGSFDQGIVGPGVDRSKPPPRPPRPGTAPQPGAQQLHSTGAALASRALAWGSLYAVLGVGGLSATIWLISGASNWTEFRQKCGGILPAIPKKPQEGRTEFSGINDFLQYVIDTDEAEKKKKKRELEQEK